MVNQKVDAFVADLLKKNVLSLTMNKDGSVVSPPIHSRVDNFFITNDHTFSVTLGLRICPVLCTSGPNICRTNDIPTILYC